MVNAVLRRSIRESEALGGLIQNASSDIRLSHPLHLIERWERRFGGESCRELCRWNNTPAEVCIRVNGLKITPGELLKSAPESERHPAHPLMFRVRHIPFQWIVGGLCYVQDPSTLIACELLAPRPGERVLDACAAPGGKTGYLAQLMGNRGEIVACDASQRRLDRLDENLRRLGVANLKMSRIDWIQDALPFQPESFDRILIDAPCSNTGVIRRRIDVRWRLAPGEFKAMQEKQLAIVRKLAPLLKKGGRLVYSTCSIEPEENEEAAARMAAEFSELRFMASRQSFPHRDAMDGAYAAKFERV
jgi:16S rRNA (cytosine967-C5)-methyltransferase